MPAVNLKRSAIRAKASTPEQGKPRNRSKRSAQKALSSGPLTATISSKGQIVIPVQLRQKYRLDEGVPVVFREENGHLLLDPNPFAALLALRGSIPFDLEGALLEEKKREREREDRQR